MRFDGMVGTIDGALVPGKILGLWMELRKHTGTVEAKKKEGVKFKVRANEDLIDKIRERCNELGILIYPGEATGTGFVVEDGTMATVQIVVVAQAIEDGSCLGFGGFGLGADNQDKAGGKAGTYAFKQAVLQALLAGGSKDKTKLPDTDDTDEAIPGGVRKKTPGKVKALTKDELVAMLKAANVPAEYEAAKAHLMTATPEVQVAARDEAFAAKARCYPPTT